MDPAFLNNPTFLELDDAYRGLANHDFLKVKTTDLKETIQSLEKIGFVAIKVESFNHEAQSYVISASKGKHGPCFFTGKTVSYNGFALAALDDDNHLLFQGVAKHVCDKTSQVFSLTVFSEFVSGSILTEKPVITDEAAEFERNQLELLDQLRSVKAADANRASWFYSGPFRLLILNDGTIARRGQWSSIPIDIPKNLLKSEGFKNWKSDEDVTPRFFQNEYVRQGPACLLENIKPKKISVQDDKTDFSSLKTISKKFKEKLINQIETEKSYFVLIGNEVDDVLGCCPSAEVSEANSLVRSGILEGLSEQVQGDECPVTIYAFKNELKETGQSFSHTFNKYVREKIKDHLKSLSPPIGQMLLKWTLLAFIGISLIFATMKSVQFYQAENQRSIHQILDINESKTLHVILFHNRKRCFQCLRMEEFTKEVIEKEFEAEYEARRIAFELIIIDDPENSELVEEFGIFASTLVLITTEHNKITDTKVLLEATGLYQREPEFKAHLKEEIQYFIPAYDE